jgi:hypothetical protein
VPTRCPRFLDVPAGKQDLTVDVGLGLRTPRAMANIGNFENMPSILFNLWNNGQEESR